MTKKKKELLLAPLLVGFKRLFLVSYIGAGVVFDLEKEKNSKMWYALFAPE